ncbi:MAG TPA: 4Fe-4S dicluster domain-containing protein [Longimicrobiales bacterium]
MKTLKLAREDLDLFAAVLQQFGVVHAPVRDRGSVRFQRIQRWSDVELKYTRTVLPPKKYFLPQRETLLYYDKNGYRPATDQLDERIVLFGVHACDIRGLNILDEVFLQGPHIDPYYQARRSNVIVIGIDCLPDEHCFCRSMRADFVEKGFDLFLYEIGEDYLVLVNTALGDDMVLATKSLFHPVTRADVEEYKTRSQALRASQIIDVEIRDLPEILELEYDSELWQELGSKCLACGSCSMVCPTCYCYDVADDITVGCNAGTRCRQWDSCLFSSHAQVAGGENFRAQQADRVKYRFYHKHRGFVAEYGHPSCVGCGRCTTVCPVGINDVTVINRLLGVSHVSH